MLKAGKIENGFVRGNTDAFYSGRPIRVPGFRKPPNPLFPPFESDKQRYASHSTEGTDGRQARVKRSLSWNTATPATRPRATHRRAILECGRWCPAGRFYRVNREQQQKEDCRVLSITAIETKRATRVFVIPGCEKTSSNHRNTEMCVISAFFLL